VTKTPEHFILRFLQFFSFTGLFPMRNDYALQPSTSTAIYDKVAYRGATVHFAAGRYNPLLMLVWIFVVSVAFQGARVYLYKAKGDWQSNNKKGGWEYRPYAGPDFWRWVEYALTAPLQIVIIASSFMLGDKAVLLVLGGLQGGLMLLGFSIEQSIRKVSKHTNKTNGRQRNYKGKLVYLLVSAWALHAIVWFVLFERFYRQKDNITACGLTEKMPWAVSFLVYTQAGLFSAFGFVQTWQALKVLFAKKMPESQCSTCVPGKRMPKKDLASWETVSMLYALLSVVAKTLLEFGFLVLVRQVPNLTQ
jgi:hypothetical protein